MEWHGEVSGIEPGWTDDGRHKLGMKEFRALWEQEDPVAL